MNFKVLVENKTCSEQLNAVHGISFYIETKAHKILFDLGPNDYFIKNAAAMGVDLSLVDTVVISHGHDDHGGGLRQFLKLNKTALVYLQKSAFDCYYVKMQGETEYIGLEQELREHPRIILIDGDYQIDDELRLFSSVPEKECLSSANDTLFVKDNNTYQKDNFAHEQNLIISENDKNILLAGCAHRGIVNIYNSAIKFCGSGIHSVISGFHLFNPDTQMVEDEKLINDIAGRLLSSQTQYYTCHCTGYRAFKILHQTMGERIKYISTGTELTI